MKSMEDWASLDKDHSVSLLGAIGALKASTLRLPVIGGAMVCAVIINLFLKTIKGFFVTLPLVLNVKLD